LYNKVLEARNTAAMSNDNRLEIAALYQKLASLKKFQGKFFEAEALAKKSLDTYHAILGSTAIAADVSSYFNNMALINYEQKRYDEAEVLLQKSLDIAKKAFGAQHLKVAQCMSDLGNLYLKKGNFKEAENVLRQSLVMTEISLGKNFFTF
jgi:tetratricopeptide (TPR) repeat protein